MASADELLASDSPLFQQALELSLTINNGTIIRRIYGSRAGGIRQKRKESREMLSCIVLFCLRERCGFWCHKVNEGYAEICGTTFDFGIRDLCEMHCAKLEISVIKPS
ncbi:hypothetical protein CDAR_383011 [Caerostris darwini]|uniref:Uncharacterized protein n=1 Tax=Caerostris darwini TaxID=1538125 RepID=A0AAV4NS88_9ARAC|nr:hypothetical protein CDAR_383011 [Caerostris darwini]